MNIVNQTIMKMSILRRLTSVIAALACIVSAMALDLPVKTLKGTKYYYYKVKKNETVYGVSKKLGLTRDEIVSHNPAADDGIKKGMVLFPLRRICAQACRGSRRGRGCRHGACGYCRV